MPIAFGECVLDTETRLLLRAGSAVHLTPKAFDLLHALLEHRPRVLSKAALRQRLWGETHVLEANLPNLVAEVREAIGDAARKPRFIRTVHGLGYAFCGEAVDRGPGVFPGTERPIVYRLEWTEGLVALAEGEYLLGRHRDSVVPIDTHAVSRRHARLHVGAGEAILEDLASRNGTFVRGERLAGPARLVDGDEFQLGPLRFVLRVPQHPASTDTRDA